jgi:hypothetical protein
MTQKTESPDIPGGRSERIAGGVADAGGGLAP